MRVHRLGMVFNREPSGPLDVRRRWAGLMEQQPHLLPQDFEGTAELLRGRAEFFSAAISPRHIFNARLRLAC